MIKLVVGTYIFDNELSSYKNSMFSFTFDSVTVPIRNDHLIYPVSPATTFKSHGKLKKKIAIIEILGLLTMTIDRL